MKLSLQAMVPKTFSKPVPCHLWTELQKHPSRPTFPTVAGDRNLNTNNGCCHRKLHFGLGIDSFSLFIHQKWHWYREREGCLSFVVAVDPTQKCSPRAALQGVDLSHSVVSPCGMAWHRSAYHRRLSKASCIPMHGWEGCGKFITIWPLRRNIFVKFSKRFYRQGTLSKVYLRYFGQHHLLDQNYTPLSSPSR